MMLVSIIKNILEPKGKSRDITQRFRKIDWLVRKYMKEYREKRLCEILNSKMRNISQRERNMI